MAAPANPLHGLTNDLDYIHSFLKSVKGPVVLVGHSYGGSVISQAAAGAPNVKALVYVAAFAPEKGETPAELGEKFAGAGLSTTLNAVPVSVAGGTGIDLYVKADKFHSVVAPDVPKSLTDLAAFTQRPVAANAFTDKPTEAAWKTIPSWDLITTQDKAIVPAAQRFGPRCGKSESGPPGGHRHQPCRDFFRARYAATLLLLPHISYECQR